MNEQLFDENRELKNQRIDLQNRLLEKEMELQTHLANVDKVEKLENPGTPARKGKLFHKK
jgi:hypothetical protein